MRYAFRVVESVSPNGSRWYSVHGHRWAAQECDRGEALWFAASTLLGGRHEFMRPRDFLKACWGCGIWTEAAEHGRRCRWCERVSGRKDAITFWPVDSMGRPYWTLFRASGGFLPYLSNDEALGVLAAVMFSASGPSWLAEPRRYPWDEPLEPAGLLGHDTRVESPPPAWLYCAEAF